MTPGMARTRSPRRRGLSWGPALLFSVWAAIPSGGVAAGMAERAHPAPLAPHRDGNVAIAEELDAARRAGTIAAYDLFLARHSDHKLARIARRERLLIMQRAGGRIRP